MVTLIAAAAILTTPKVNYTSVATSFAKKLVDSGLLNIPAGTPKLYQMKVTDDGKSPTVTVQNDAFKIQVTKSTGKVSSFSVVRSGAAQTIKSDRTVDPTDTATQAYRALGYANDFVSSTQNDQVAIVPSVNGVLYEPTIYQTTIKVRLGFKLVTTVQAAEVPAAPETRPELTADIEKKCVADLSAKAAKLAKGKKFTLDNETIRIVEAAPNAGAQYVLMLQGHSTSTNGKLACTWTSWYSLDKAKEVKGLGPVPATD
ncbi:hypothetical protein BH11ARM1_BH11ARM1_05030 [soil metagenome]